MYKTLIILSVAALLLGSCKKEANHCNTTAVIYDSGPLAGDGCDWVVNVDSVTSYHPVNLDAIYKVNNLHVKVNYIFTGDTFFCGWGVKLRSVRLNCIEKQ